MLDPNSVPDVSADELLSRFVLSRSHFRTSDGTVKPDAFIPAPYVELSLTRHLSATSDEVWTVGQGIATGIGKTLYGRAELLAQEFVDVGLKVVKQVVVGNPNHVGAIGWPAEKSAQKLKAIILANASVFVVTQLGSVGS